MGKYDICIFKKNIKKMMENKNVKQETICNITGLQQPQVSKNLSNKTSNFFTLEQTLEIADYFGVTVNELLMPSEKTTEVKKLQIETASDLLNILFDISHVTPINIELITVDKEVKPIDNNVLTHERYAIYFNNKFINETIGEWQKISDATSSVKDKESGKRLLELWEKDIVSNASDRLASWYFRDTEEQGKYCVQMMSRRWINLGCKDDPGRFDKYEMFFNFPDEDIKAAEKYIEMQEYLPFHSDSELDDIENAKSVLECIHQYDPF